MNRFLPLSLALSLVLHPVFSSSVSAEPINPLTQADTRGDQLSPQQFQQALNQKQQARQQRQALIQSLLNPRPPTAGRTRRSSAAANGTSTWTATCTSTRTATAGRTGCSPSAGPVRSALPVLRFHRWPDQRQPLQRAGRVPGIILRTTPLPGKDFALFFSISYANFTISKVFQSEEVRKDFP